MAKNDDNSQDKITCRICGYGSPAGSDRCEHCYHLLNENGSAKESQDGVDALMSIPGVGETKAEALHEAGYKTVKDLQEAKVEELASIKGIGEKLAAKIIEGAKSLDKTEDRGLADWLSGEDEGLSSWLSGDERPGQAAEAAAKPEYTDQNDSLAKWLAGSESDIDSWLQETAGMPQAGTAIPRGELLAREAEIIQMRETLKEKLKQLETGEFDPQATIEELAKLKADIELEREIRVKLEEELENVKRGSIAVIKFIKGQHGATPDNFNMADRLTSEMALRENLELKIMELEGVLKAVREKAEQGFSEMPPDTQELKRQEMMLAERQAQMDALESQLRAKEEALKEGLINYGKQAAQAPPGISTEEWIQKEQGYMEQVNDLRIKLSAAEIELKQKAELMKITSAPGKTIDPDLMRKIEDTQRTERTLAVREQEVQRLREELQIRDEEMKKIKEPMKYKEDEMLRREEDLMFRERALQEELRQVSRQKAELTSTDELTLKKRLEELQSQVTEKEEEIRRKEKYLGLKEEELRNREQGLIGEEIDKREADRVLELKIEKVKTGTSRLDDLLLGGVPFGANVLVYGPPFTGKEVLVNVFIAEGLKKGVPALWISTEKAPKELREEMMFVLSGYEEYEKRGLVRYVDSYSRSMGDETQDPYTEYIDSPTDYEALSKAVEKVSKELKEKHEYYRVGFRSISTMIAYLDPNTAFRFLSPIAGRRKRDRAVSMYTIEKGVHGEQEIQMIGSVMDGMIEFKVENLNTFLAIRGICDVQSRAYIRYSATKTGVTIGSFSLDHIR